MKNNHLTILWKKLKRNTMLSSLFGTYILGIASAYSLSVFIIILIWVAVAFGLVSILSLKGVFNAA